MIRHDEIVNMTIIDLDIQKYSKKREREKLIEQSRKLRKDCYNLSMEINKIEEKIDEIIRKRYLKER